MVAGAATSMSVSNVFSSSPPLPSSLLSKLPDDREDMPLPSLLMAPGCKEGTPKEQDEQSMSHSVGSPPPPKHVLVHPRPPLLPVFHVGFGVLQA
jgi:hypothetical protein